MWCKNLQPGKNRLRHVRNLNSKMSDRVSVLGLEQWTSLGLGN